MFTQTTAAAAGRKSSRKDKPNKVTTDIRQLIKGLLEDNAEQIQADFLSLDAKDRLNIAIKLLDYIIPKATIQSMEVPVQRTDVRVVFTPEDLISDPIE
jgi:hypothetical protein